MWIYTNNAYSLHLLTSILKLCDKAKPFFCFVFNFKAKIYHSKKKENKQKRAHTVLSLKVENKSLSH